MKWPTTSLKSIRLDRSEYFCKRCHRRRPLPLFGRCAVPTCTQLDGLRGNLALAPVVHNALSSSCSVSGAYAALVFQKGLY